jgi:hypothetical protein
VAVAVVTLVAVAVVVVTLVAVAVAVVTSVAVAVAVVTLVAVAVAMAFFWEVETRAGVVSSLKRPKQPSPVHQLPTPTRSVRLRMLQQGKLAQAESRMFLIQTPFSEKADEFTSAQNTDKLGQIDKGQKSNVLNSNPFLVKRLINSLLRKILTN